DFSVCYFRFSHRNRSAHSVRSCSRVLRTARSYVRTESTAAGCFCHEATSENEWRARALGEEMTFDKLIEAALAAPPGSIMFTKQTLNQERQDEVGFAE